MTTDPNEPSLPPAPEGDYTTDGVPNFDYVRDRVEKRAATALGSTELAESTPEAAEQEKRFADRDAAARDKLEEIRRSMREDS